MEFTVKNQKAPIEGGSQQQGQQGEKKEYPTVPTGDYNATIARFEYLNPEVLAANGRTWPHWKNYEHEINVGIRIEAPGEAYDGAWVWASTELTMEAGSRDYIWMKNILNVDVLPEDFVLRTSDIPKVVKGANQDLSRNPFVGKPVRVRVEQKFGKDKYDANGNLIPGKLYTNVLQLLPPSTNQVAAAEAGLKVTSSAIVLDTDTADLYDDFDYDADPLEAF